VVRDGEGAKGVDGVGGRRGRVGVRGVDLGGSEGVLELVDAGGELSDAGVEVLCGGEDEAGALASGERAVWTERGTTSALAGVAGDLFVTFYLESATFSTGDLAWRE